MILCKTQQILFEDNIRRILVYNLCTKRSLWYNYTIIRVRYQMFQHLGSRTNGIDNTITFLLDPFLSLW